jgi:hypothetical protein
MKMKWPLLIKRIKGNDNIIDAKGERKGKGIRSEAEVKEN